MYNLQNVASNGRGNEKGDDITNIRSVCKLLHAYTFFFWHF